MANTFIAKGKHITFVAVSALASGAMYMLGNIFGVVQNAVAIGEKGVLSVCGIHKLAKSGSEAIAVGALIYFDAENAIVTSKRSKAFPCIGKAESAAAASDTTVRVKLIEALNTVNQGTVIFHSHTSAVVAGQPLLLTQGSNKTLAVALEAADANVSAPYVVDGIVSIPKAAVIIENKYDKLYFDDSSKDVTDASATGLFEVGYSLEANVAAEESHVIARIKDNFVAAEA